METSSIASPSSSDAAWKLTPGAPQPPISAYVHDDSITSIGLRQAGALDMVRVNAWLTDLLAKEGVNIFRMKGILNIRGQDMKFVFQGVHMLFSGEPLEPWNDEPRESRIVFIGRDLKKESLERHLASCLA